MEGSMSASFKNHARGSTAELLKENLKVLKKKGLLVKGIKNKKKTCLALTCLARSSSLQSEMSILSAR